MCGKKYNTFMAESAARVSFNPLLFGICSNLQLHKYVSLDNILLYIMYHFLNC